MAERVRTFLVWGAGGHGKVIGDLIRRTGHHVGGYIDRDATRLGQIAEPGGAAVVLTEAAWVERTRARRGLPAGCDALALAIGHNALRHECLDVCQAFDTPALVHPAATVSVTASLGPGAVVLPAAVINADVYVGAAAIVNSAAIVEHDCVLGVCVHVSPGAVLCGGVKVGDRSWVGAGAVVIPNIRIGCDTTIGAGAVVIRDVPDRATVVGNPARVLHTELSEVAR